MNKAMQPGRAARHIALPQIGDEGQQRIASSTALLIGLGGIGCATASYLASSGPFGSTTVFTSLDAIRKIAKDVKTVVEPNGSLLLEHGAEHQDAVATVLQNNGWTVIECIKDLAGHPRVTTA